MKCLILPAGQHWSNDLNTCMEMTEVLRSACWCFRRSSCSWPLDTSGGQLKKSCCCYPWFLFEHWRREMFRLHEGSAVADDDGGNSSRDWLRGTVISGVVSSFDQLCELYLVREWLLWLHHLLQKLGWALLSFTNLYHLRMATEPVVIATVIRLII